MRPSFSTRNPSDYEPTRKLSAWRVLLAVLLLAVLCSGTVYAAKTWQADRSNKVNKPWFASYVDVTATPTYQFQQLGTTSHRDVILSFIVSSPTNACLPSWGGSYSLNQADDDLDLNTRIARLQQQGGSVAISFGGQNNQELSVDCTNPAELLAAYQSVVDRYNISTIDLDLEGPGLNDNDAARRAVAIAALQKERRSEGKPLAVWVTLPATTQGLTEPGTTAIAELLSKGVDISGVNVMTMDFGSSLANGQSMLEGSESALIQTQRQLGILYQQAGIHLNNSSLWAKLGATPMIGQNNDVNEVFTMADATGLNQFALDHKMGRMSMWSANRDLTCGSNYVDLKIVSDSCSGVNEGSQTFAAILSNGFDGDISLSASFKTVADPNTTNAHAPDNPATSPYQIWSPSGAYLEGTKVVWHHNIYVAKWWTQGDVPDDPVLQSWETPWQLIGPVLPGEKPIPQPTLPAGTYPDWDGTTVYNTGQRVLFNGVPYQAKWWNQGASPAAASSDADNSPWVPLTQAQVNEIEADSNTTTGN